MLLICAFVDRIVIHTFSMDYTADFRAPQRNAISVERTSHPLLGGFSPSSRIAICRSAQASFFCRGSRSRYAG